MEKLNISNELETYLAESLQDIVDDVNIPENYGGCVDLEVATVTRKL